MVEIAVAPGTDTLRAAMAAATDPATVYHFILSAGTYNEIQLESVAHSAIIGAGIGSTYIVTDGTRVDVDPVSGQRYVDMDQSAKHGIWVQDSMTVAGVDWSCNDVKYCIHADSGVAFALNVTNSAFRHANGYPVGHGEYGGQSVTYSGCTFEKTGDNAAYGFVGSHGVYWHNQASQTSGAPLTLSHCTFTNTGVLLAVELGSGQTDNVAVTDCVTDDAAAGKGIYLLAQYVWQSYSIEIVQTDGTMPAFAHDEVTRPDGHAHYTLVP